MSSEKRTTAAGVTRRDLRHDHALREAVDQIVANCGEGAFTLLTSGHRYLKRKDVMKISRTTPERQVVELDRVRRGVRPHGKTDVFDTTGYDEIQSRLARAGGAPNKLSQVVLKALAAGVVSDAERANANRASRTMLADIGRLWKLVCRAYSSRPDDQLLSKGTVYRWKPPRPWGALPVTDGTLIDIIAELKAPLYFMHKSVRDLKHLPSLPKDRHFWPTRMQTHAIGIRLFRMARNLLNVRSQLAGSPVNGPVLVVTHSRPDVDALAATWLTERFLCADRPVDVLFKPYDFDWTRGSAVDYAIDLGGLFDPDLGLFDHKPPAREDRTETCATKLVWEQLTQQGYRVGGGLAEMVDAVLSGDSARRRAESFTYAMSKQKGLHAEFDRLQVRKLSDNVLYKRVRSWLDCKFADRFPKGTAKA